MDRVARTGQACQSASQTRVHLSLLFPAICILFLPQRHRSRLIRGQLPHASVILRPSGHSGATGLLISPSVENYPPLLQVYLKWNPHCKWIPDSPLKATLKVDSLNCQQEASTWNPLWYQTPLHHTMCGYWNSISVSESEQEVGFERQMFPHLAK